MKPAKRSAAQRAADARYHSKRVRIVMEFDRDDPDLHTLLDLVPEHGSRKAVLVAGLRAIKKGRR